MNKKEKEILDIKFAILGTKKLTDAYEKEVKKKGIM